MGLLRSVRPSRTGSCVYRVSAVDTDPELGCDRPMTTVQSLERGLRILDLLSEVEFDVLRRGKGIGIQQVAEELGVHKSTASRLMGTLASAGYASPRGSRRWGAGPALKGSTDLTAQQRKFQELSYPELRHLVNITGECAHAAVTAYPCVLVIADVETDKSLRVVGKAGRRVPLHCTSAGKVLLAFENLPVPERLAHRTEKTIVDIRQMSEHLDVVRRQGYAFDDEENDSGVRCLSAPVFGPGGECVGAVGIDAPTIRFPVTRLPNLTRNVIKTADAISQAMGSARRFPDVPAPLPA